MITLTDIANAGWIQTDPDAHQYGKKINKYTWRYREWNNYFHKPDSPTEALIYWHEAKYWFKMEIDVRDYTRLEIEEYISAYGYKLNHYSKGYPYELEDMDRESSIQIICECIFESTNENYSTPPIVTGPGITTHMPKHENYDPRIKITELTCPNIIQLLDSGGNNDGLYYTNRKDFLQIQKDIEEAFEHAESICNQHEFEEPNEDRMHIHDEADELLKEKEIFRTFIFCEAKTNTI